MKRKAARQQDEEDNKMNEKVPTASTRNGRGVNLFFILLVRACGISFLLSGRQVNNKDIDRPLIRRRKEKETAAGLYRVMTSCL